MSMKSPSKKSGDAEKEDVVSQLYTALGEEEHGFTYRRVKAEKNLYLLGESSEGSEDQMAKSVALDGFHLHVYLGESDGVGILAVFTANDISSDRRAKALSELAAGKYTPDLSNKYHVPLSEVTLAEAPGYIPEDLRDMAAILSGILNTLGIAIVTKKEEKKGKKDKK